MERVQKGLADFMKKRLELQEQHDHISRRRAFLMWRTGTRDQKAALEEREREMRKQVLLQRPSNRSKEDLKRVTEWLHRQRAFPGLEEARLADYARYARLQHFEEGEPLFLQGTTGQFYYVCYSGSVELFSLKNNLVEKRRILDQERDPQFWRRKDCRGGFLGVKVVSLKSGGLGEYGLIPPFPPRSCAVVAGEDGCDVLKLEKNLYLDILYDYHSKNLSHGKAVNFLRTTAAFAHWPGNYLHQLAHLCVQVVLEASVCFLKQGEPITEVFLVAEGTVETRRDGVRLSRLGSGAMMGQDCFSPFGSIADMSHAAAKARRATSEDDVFTLTRTKLFAFKASGMIDLLLTTGVGRETLVKVAQDFKAKRRWRRRHFRLARRVKNSNRWLLPDDPQRSSGIRRDSSGSVGREQAEAAWPALDVQGPRQRTKGHSRRGGCCAGRRGGGKREVTERPLPRFDPGAAPRPANERYLPWQPRVSLVEHVPSALILHAVEQSGRKKKKKRKEEGGKEEEEREAVGAGEHVDEGTSDNGQSLLSMSLPSLAPNRQSVASRCGLRKSRKSRRPQTSICEMRLARPQGRSDLY
eukprot:scaffold764_cov248-Pinguiococcus_pyrenoidosus.AAC.32